MTRVTGSGLKVQTHAPTLLNMTSKMAVNELARTILQFYFSRAPGLCSCWVTLFLICFKALLMETCPLPCCPPFISLLPIFPNLCPLWLYYTLFLTKHLALLLIHGNRGECCLSTFDTMQHIPSRGPQVKGTIHTKATHSWLIGTWTILVLAN